MSSPVAVIIEDEPQIRRFVRSALEAEGWQVHEAGTAQRGLTEAGTRKPDLLVLDLGLPDGDGLELVRQIRQSQALPILILSARHQEAQKIQALDAGADDYLVKPFSVGELLARMRVALRHRGTALLAAVTQHELDDLRVDLDTRRVQRAGETLHLTPTEYKLLARLVRSAGRVVTHRQLLADVWGPEYTEHTHYLRLYMAQLRAKIERDPAEPRHLLTETGVGYRLAVV